jgi:hypothetical protein
MNTFISAIFFYFFECWRDEPRAVHKLGTAALLIVTFLPLCLQYWSLKSGFCAFEAGALLLKPHLQPLFFFKL